MAKSTGPSTSVRQVILRAAVHGLLGSLFLAGTASAQLVADFTATPTSGINPLSVQFTDATTGGTPVSWFWDFGDGGQSFSEQSPEHTYTLPGTYSVQFIAIAGPLDFDTVTKVDFITVGSAPLVIDFEASPTQGLNPLPVTFTDLSTGGFVTARVWDFGDGSTSALPNPIHIYEVTETTSFTVSLTLFQGGQPTTLTQTDLITVNPAPLMADFTSTTTGGFNPLTVNFIDQSTGPVTNWLWDFGDGATSTFKNSSHVYEVTETTTFTVSLTAFVGVQSDTMVKTDYITVSPAPLAVDFIANPTLGTNPMTVEFRDTSTGGDVSAWSWNFGDGSTSALKNPVHTYEAATLTSYTVTLTAFVGQQSDTLVKTDFITVEPAPLLADFTATPTLGNGPLQVRFRDTSKGATPTAWSWDFGDGASSTLKNPAHTYQVTETTSFTVSLTIFLGPQSSMRVKRGFITVEFVPLVVDFVAHPTDGVNPLLVHFRDTSTGPATTAWMWEFGDGTGSTLKNPTHTYQVSEPTSFTVSLHAFSGSLDEMLVKTNLITVFPAPLVVDFSAEPTQGVAPLTVRFSDESTGATTTAWSWDFGDGGTSSLQNPIHLYNMTGLYSVSLTGFVGPQSGMIGKPDFISVDPALFGPRQIITGEAAFAQSADVTDLDGDGDADVLSASVNDDKVAWYGNTDGLGVFGPQQLITVSAKGADSVFAADVDGDGDADVLSASVFDDTIAWYENTDGLGNFGPAQVITTAAMRVKTVFAADLDSDGDIDVLSASVDDDKIAWYENRDGRGTFGPEHVITTSAEEAITVFATDLDADGDIDVLSASRGDNKLAWYENTDGSGSFGPQQIISMEADNVRSVYAADLDGDGDADVLSASTADDTIAWYENTDGRGSFGPQQVITRKADNAWAVFAKDLDGDGDADVLSTSRFDNKVAWYENTDGAGTFGYQRIISTVANRPVSVFAVDLDGDTDADVLSSSEADGTVEWYENLSEHPDYFLVVGDGSGDALFVRDEHLFATQLGEVVDFRRVVDHTPATYLLPGQRQAQTDASPAWLRDGTFTVQVVGWNPDAAHPVDLASNGLAIQVLLDGQLISQPFGASTGLELRVETGVDDQGRPVVRFSFEHTGHVSRVMK